MPRSDSGLRRVAVHADTAHADLTLPSGVPVAALVTLVADLLPTLPTSRNLQPYRLCAAGGPALDGSKTLAQQGIQDGSILVLTRAEYTEPQVLFDDPAEQVAAIAQAAAQPWNPAARRLTAALLASSLVGVAGCAVVPGRPLTPSIVLGLAAAGTAALVTVGQIDVREPARMTLCCLAGLAILTAIAGLAAAAAGVPLSSVGASAAVVGVIGIRAAGRVAAAVTGMSRLPDAPASKAAQAHSLLTGLVVAGVLSVALGVGVLSWNPLVGVPHAVNVVFAVATGVALVLRSRSHADGTQVAALVSGGVTAVGIAVLAAAAGTASRWPAATAAALAGMVIWFGFMSPRQSPLAHRIADVTEGLALGSLVPLGCWVSGCYGIAGSLGLG